MDPYHHSRPDTFLPDELWVHILQYLSARDAWKSARLVNRQLSRIILEQLTSAKHMSRFSIDISVSLGSGSHHRWYDVRGRITFAFQHFNRHNAQYAHFGSCVVHPAGSYARAMEQWKRMCGTGMGERVEWRIQEGVDGEAKIVRLPKLVLDGEGSGLYVDWRELFDAYYGKSGSNLH